jgi:hypothetical protein
MRFMSQDPGKLLTLAQAGERLQWSVRTVRRRLAAHGIATIGPGKRARLTPDDFNRLIEAERQYATVAAASRPGAPDQSTGRTRSGVS